MLAVSRDHVVIRPKRRKRTDRNRLLTDIQVTEPADLTDRVSFGSLFLEAPPQQHLVQPMVQRLLLQPLQIVSTAIARGRRRCGSGSGFPFCFWLGHSS